MDAHGVIQNAYRENPNNPKYVHVSRKAARMLEQVTKTRPRTLDEMFAKEVLEDDDNVEEPGPKDKKQ